ncbi:MAG: ABC transporter substrate-binding protein [Actinomycetota bacterium]
MTKLLLEPPVDDLTRREFIGGGLAALLLAGCSRTAEESGDQAAPKAGFSYTFTHRFGNTTIPSEPKRVVAAGYNDVDYLLALGVKPLGVAANGDPDQMRPWARELIGKDKPPIVHDAELNYEQIAALSPDVIVFYQYLSVLEGGGYERLAGIAPTVCETTESALYPQHTLEIGRAVGREERAQQIVASMEERFAQARAAHPEFQGKKVAIGGPVPEEGRLVVMGPDDPRTGFFTSLGFLLPEATGFEISPERAEVFDQDLLVLYGSKRSDVEGDPLSSRLAVVREQRVVSYVETFDGTHPDGLSYDPIGWDSPLSLPYALDQMVPRLAAALAR